MLETWVERYRALGWKVHAIPPELKFPPFAGWPDLPSMDVEDLEEMPDGWKLGIQTGPESGIIALDIDDVSAAADLDLDVGLYATTRRGYHFIFKWPEDWPAAKGVHKAKVRDKVDIKGYHGILKVQPSEGYQWQNWGAEIPPLPANLRILIEKNRKPVPKVEFDDDRLKTIGRHLAGFDWEGSGDGSSALVKRCRQAILGFAVRQTEDWLQVAALGNATRTTPWSEEELTARFEDALGRAESEGWDLESPVLVSTSHTSLAKDVTDAWGMPLVHCEGCFWTYVDGFWDKVADDAIERFIAGFDGRDVLNKRGKVERLGLYNNDIVGIRKRMEANLEKPEFFTEAEPVIVMTNGTLLVSAAGVHLVEHAASHRARKKMPFAWEPERMAMQSERWSERIAEWLPANNGLRELLQEYTGCCLIGRATYFQKCLILDGAGANGKSSFVNTVAQLFTNAETAAVPPQDWGGEYARARLAGVRFNVMAEMPSNKIIQSDVFKAVVVGDAVEARHPYGRSFTLRSTAGHLFSTNELPPTVDQSEGWWRRFLVIPFTQVFQVEAGFQDKLDRLLEGAFFWAIEGAARLLKRGHFDEPEASKQAKADWQFESDQVAQFLNSLERVSQENGTPARKVYMNYQRWAQNTGHRPVTEKTFTMRCKRLGVGFSRHEKYNILGLRMPTMN